MQMQSLKVFPRSNQRKKKVGRVNRPRVKLPMIYGAELPPEVTFCIEEKADILQGHSPRISPDRRTYDLSPMSMGWKELSDVESDITADNFERRSALGQCVNEARSKQDEFERVYRNLCFQYNTIPLSCVLSAIHLSSRRDVDLRNARVDKVSLSVIILALSRLPSDFCIIDTLTMDAFILSLPLSILKNADQILYARKMTWVLDFSKRQHSLSASTSKFLKHLSSMTSIGSLILSDYTQWAKSLADILSSLKASSCHLTSLTLTNSHLDSHSMKSLKSSITSLSLKCLSLTHCCIRSSHLVDLLEACKKLEELNLSENSLDTKSMKHLNKLLTESDTLKQLNLSGNPLYTVSGLTQGIQKSSTLQYLKLNRCNLTHGGVIYLLEMLSKTKHNMTTVEIMNNFSCFKEGALKEALLELSNSRPDIQVLSDVIKLSSASEQLNHPLTGSDVFKKLLVHTEREKISLFDLFAEFADPTTWTITSDQLYAGVKQKLNMKILKEDVDQLISYLDTDNNGLLDYGELLQGQKQYEIRRTQQAQDELLRNAIMSGDSCPYYDD